MESAMNLLGQLDRFEEKDTINQQSFNIALPFGIRSKTIHTLLRRQSLKYICRCQWSKSKRVLFLPMIF